MHSNISIIGAGIGGLTLGLVLKQKGISATLFERAQEIKPVGAGIVIANNAMQVFDALGIKNKIELAGNRISKMVITDPKNRIISDISLSKFERQYNASNIAIHRADLQNILAEEINPDHIRLGKRLMTIDELEEYYLHFEDGTSHRTDIIIGADGIKSSVRNLLFPQSQIRSAHQLCWRGISQIRLPKEQQHTAFESWGKGKRMGYVQINPNQVYWYAAVNTHLIKGNATRSLAELFHEFHSLYLDLMTQTDKYSIHFSEISDLKPIKHWSQKDACLIGDAAHATTPNMGQGACQAIEDAYTIGHLLNTSPASSFTGIFQRFQEMREKKVNAIVRSSRTIGRISQLENNYAIAIRNTLMRMIPQQLNSNTLKNIFNINYMH